MPRRTLLKWLSLGLGAGLGGSPMSLLARDVAATVLGQTIYRDELRVPEDLGPLIIRPLLLRFAAEHRLTATSAEVDELQSALKMPPLPAGLTAAERAELRKIPEGMVLDWKVSRALYRRYGGDVIFQQANPLEPVGAMRRFLEEQERSGAFVIHSATDRERFYAYYTRTHPFVVPASEVNYDKPWWRK